MMAGPMRLDSFTVSFYQTRVSLRERTRPGLGIIETLTKSRLGICCTIAALGFSGISALKTDHSMETIKAVCDELGRCWETGSEYGVGAAPGYWYNPYSGYEADMTVRNCDVRFTPESGYQLTDFGCPLCGKSGHELCEQG